MANPALYWFRDDLRLTDLPGLVAAAESGPVAATFIWDETLGEEWSLGGASRWWLHYSLQSLIDDLERLGVTLILRKGRALEQLPCIAKQLGATTVYCSRHYQPWANDLESTIHAALAAEDISLKRFPGTLLFEPESVATGSGPPFKVFTPFWRNCLNRPEPAAPQPLPKLTPARHGIPSESLADWHLLPQNPNWAEGWESLWSPGEAGATEQLNTFLADHVRDYGDGRDVPAEPNTSRLSPFLRFGNLSPRRVWHAAQAAKLTQPRATASIDKFLSEIGWREFCYHLLFHFPTMPHKAFNPKFEQFPWGTNATLLSAWQRGQTGYPIVDAGMRELWQTGFMHNRVRMVVASFLTKHLLLSWQEGEAWFWDCLLDADLASNACSWQWVGGSGADAAPYFRIFNPVAQGEKFDKAGLYTRRWVPELAQVPDKYLHRPWEAPGEVLKQAAVTLGDSYPLPVVDHKQAREDALSAYASLKQL